MEFFYSDGGRFNAGYKGHTGDCVARSIAIAANKPYQEVYDFLANGHGTQRTSKLKLKQIKDDFAAKGLSFDTPEYKAYVQKRTKTKTAANGINTTRQWFKDYMRGLGFEWIPTMGIGTGCKVHLNANELPQTGALVVSVSKHYTAVVDGVLFDTHDCSREGNRCVYGYWFKK